MEINLFVNLHGNVMSYFSKNSSADVLNAYKIVEYYAFQ